MSFVLFHPLVAMWGSCFLARGLRCRERVGLRVRAFLLASLRAGRHVQWNFESTLCKDAVSLDTERASDRPAERMGYFRRS